MPKFPTLTVDKRTLLGRKVKQLRRQGIIPANVFGSKINSIAIQVPEKTFAKIFTEVGETGIVEVVIGEKKYPSLIAGYAQDPVTHSMLHVDFHHVSLKEKVTATIPIHAIGEAPAVKDQGGVLNVSLYEIDVEALPTELPESIEVDITGLTAIGDAVYVKDLNVPTGVELQVDPEAIVLSITEPVPEEVVEEVPETETPAETATPEAGSTDQPQTE